MEKFPRYEPVTQDHSSTIVFKNCPRKYFYRMVLGRVSRTELYKPVFEFGTAYHKFRETLESEYIKEKLMDKAFSVALIPLLEYKNDCDPNFKFAYLTRERLIKTCKMAYERWCEEKRLDRITVIDVEQAFNCQLGNEYGIIIGGRFDQIVKWNNKIWIRDFKTTSKEEKWYDKQLDPNDQATRYIYGGGKLHGSRIEGIIFDVVYNTKTVGPKFFQKLITKTSYQLAQWELEQKFINKLLVSCRSEDVWPMMEHGCSFCDYSNVCKSPNEASMMSKLENDYICKPWINTNVEQIEIV